MDINLSVQQLRAERPAAIEAVQRLIAASNPAARQDLNTVLTTLLELQGTLHDKRTLAARMIRRRTYTSPDGKTGIGFCLWHLPDVFLRALCRVADVPTDGAASDEWLDEMERRAVARQLPNGYSEVTP